MMLLQASCSQLRQPRLHASAASPLLSVWRVQARQPGNARQLSDSVPKLPLHINGKAVDSKATEFYDVIDPATQKVLWKVPQATHAEMESAVAVSKAAQKDWAASSVSERQRVMFAFQHLIREDMDNLAKLVTQEQGKTLADARGDVFRGLEVVEFACGAASHLMGETMENVGKKIDTYRSTPPPAFSRAADCLVVTHHAVPPATAFPSASRPASRPSTSQR